MVARRAGRSSRVSEERGLGRLFICFFFQAEDGIRAGRVTGVQTCALPISRAHLKIASFNSVIASAYASATFRNAEVLHAMGMLSGLRERWLTKQNEGLQLRSEERRVGKECRYGCATCRSIE